MADPGAARARLAERLRELRTSGRGGTSLTQAQVANALGTSVPLVSSWENANAIPPEERLKSYALLFAAERFSRQGKPHLAEETDLSDDEEEARRRLIDELVALRDQAVRPSDAPTRQTGALGGRFWYFPDGASVRIVTTKMWPSVLGKIPYADPRHPNYIQSFADADRDATIELFGHIRAENPTADVRFLTADQVTHEDLSGHIIILGQGDRVFPAENKLHPQSEYEPGSVLEFFAPRLELPIRMRISPEGETDFDSEFVVTQDEEGRPKWYPRGQPPLGVEVHRPRWLRDPAQSGWARLRDGGYPVLEYDVALLLRRRNPLNLATTVTVCTGVFSRGTFGAVRTLTDVNFRTRNENFLVDYFGNLDDFWLLFHVPVFRGVSGLDTITPDLERPFHRLRSSRSMQT